MTFSDRQEAGRQLAKVLARFKSKDTVVLALPRGGIVLAAEVAKELKAPLGVVMVRKIGHPFYEEYAIGAVAEDDEPVYNQAEAAGVDKAWLAQAKHAARELIAKRRRLYYGPDYSPPDVKSKTVILVDDGIATGLTMQAAVQAMKSNKAKRVIVAVPVAPQDSVDTLQGMADEVIVLDDPSNFGGAVGAHYLEFDQVSDEEVKKYLREVTN